MPELKKAEDVVGDFILYSFIDPTTNLVLHDKWQKLGRNNEHVEPIPMFILEYKHANDSKERNTFLISLGKEKRSVSVDLLIEDTEITYNGGKLKFDKFDELTYKTEFVKLVCQYPELYEKAFL